MAKLAPKAAKDNREACKRRAEFLDSYNNNMATQVEHVKQRGTGRNSNGESHHFCVADPTVEESSVLTHGKRHNRTE